MDWLHKVSWTPKKTHESHDMVKIKGAVVKFVVFLFMWQLFSWA